jgi:hypothetical protein
MLLASARLARAVRVTKSTKIYYFGWLALAGLAVFIFALASYQGLAFEHPQTNIKIFAVLGTICLIFFALFGRSSRVGVMIGYLMLWIATGPLGFALSYVCATLNFPILDRALDGFDKTLGFDWLAWYTFVNAHSALKDALTAAYTSMPLQIIFSIIYFSHREESHRSNELWWTALIAVVITVVASGIFPAMGSYEYYGVVNAKQGIHLPDLHALRDGTLTILSFERAKGIVTLPSFHTVMTILLTYIYRRQYRILYAVLPLNVLQLAAIPSEGGHYIADMVAGAAVAAIAIWIVGRIGFGTALAPQQKNKIDSKHTACNY